METAEEYKKQLDKELDDFVKDRALMGSPLWERMQTIFKLRREMLMSMVMSSDDDNAAIANKLKGRFQEVEYFVTFSDGLRSGEVVTRQKLDELDAYQLETELQEREGDPHAG